MIAGFRNAYISNLDVNDNSKIITCALFLREENGVLKKNLLAVLRFYSWIIGTMDPGWGRMAVLLCLVMTASLTSGK